MSKNFFISYYKPEQDLIPGPVLLTSINCYHSVSCDEANFRNLRNEKNTVKKLNAMTTPAL